jgi:predicted ATPase
MEAAFREISGGEGHQRPVNILERELPVQRRAIGVIWFDFATLCMGPRSQNDYLEIARRYHTVFLSGVPRMTREHGQRGAPLHLAGRRLLRPQGQARHDRRVRGRRALPRRPAGHEFHRTVSRLIEMRTREYLVGVSQFRERDGHKKLCVIRSTFIVDKEGIVRHALYDVQPKGHAAEVYQLVKGLNGKGTHHAHR